MGSAERVPAEITDLVAAAKAAYDAEHRTGRVGRRNPEGIPGFTKAYARDTGLNVHDREVPADLTDVVVPSPGAP